MKNKLKVFRAVHDLTQEELAGKLGVTRQTIVSIENGRYDPSLGLAFRIARLFDTSIEDVFDDQAAPAGAGGLSPASSPDMEVRPG